MNPESPGKPRRRPRYSGNHPRRFSEKYKELNASRYPETVAQVLAAGKTPAGMHRPICLAEILELFQLKPGMAVVDATLGYGGHARAMLECIQPGGLLVGLDTDPLELPKTEARLRAAGIAAEALRVHHSNFAALPRILAADGVEGVDCILADLGCSSMQLDNPERGFSFKHDGPLDLRMNPRKGLPATEWLGKQDQDGLARMLVENADEPRAEAIAAQIIAQQSREPLATTGALAKVVREALSAVGKFSEAEQKATLQRVFQAVRIAVNDEFSALETFLRFLPSCLKPGGCVAVLTFHSGEDRRVKKFFQASRQNGLYEAIADEPVRPSAAEIQSNPRAASAKLRWARRSLDV